MEYKLQTQPGTAERSEEVEQIALLRDEPLSFQVGYYNLLDGLMLYPEWHPLLRRQERFKGLDTPFRRHRYTSSNTVGSLMEHRWTMENSTHKEWIAAYTHDVLTYTSLNYLTSRAVRELHLPPTTESHNFILNSLWVRLFTQTEEGFQTEFKAKKLVILHDGACEAGGATSEFKDHIDFISPVAGYQVKTTTFLRRTTNALHHADQRNNIAAQARWSRQMELPVFYLIKDDIDEGRFWPISLLDAAKICGFPELVEQAPVPALLRK